MNSYVNEQNGIFPAVCPLDCPDQCGLLLHKVNGTVIKVEGDPNHPVTKGHICNKVRNMPARINDQNRLKYPMKRIGAKGSGKFEQISWTEALDTISNKWKTLIAEHGPETILPYSFYGNMGNLTSEGMGHAFFNALGASRLDRTICNSAGAKGYKYTMGASRGIDPEDTIHSKLFIFWGINAVSTNMHQILLAQKARKQGAKIIVIDVHKNQTGRLADWFIPIQPGTDSALALGMMHILFKENMVDYAFLEKFTVGHDELKKHVTQYDPKTVSEITGVPEDDLYKLSRLYGEISPSYIRIGNGLQHHDNGGMAVRTIACLPALTGQWLVKGGGAIKSNSGYLSYNSVVTQRPDLLENPNTRTINMNLLGQALLDLEPKIHSMYVYNSNPAIVAPNCNKVRAGLAREDLFLVVHDLFMTETAFFADIILPATSSFENMDFYASYWHHYIQIQKPVIEPHFEAKSNVEVFQLLAKEMGFTDPIFKESEETLIRKALDYQENPYIEHINFESLIEQNYQKCQSYTFDPGNLPTPSGKIELYSGAMAQAGLPPLPTYLPLKDDGDFPFKFIPAPNHNFINSTFANNEFHVELEKNPVAYINHVDALDRGIHDGDTVRIWNNRGACELKVKVGEDVLPSVIVTQGLWTHRGTQKHLVNALTPDRVADMGGGATFFSGRVNIEKI
ncbi:molybdopterin-dependent oxidoreductase [Calidifontibacillus oryziterrae]|uniref:molybdopterin-dependent oxidoreductase n=1 Tax=Calidifontibacillus oryziterrae TaxID=1191699 RepID=UPI000319E825|nr:molybdopterin-dependent oxidoreductase [Calidifontibacillus oryziterrae]